MTKAQSRFSQWALLCAFSCGAALLLWFMILPDDRAAGANDLDPGIVQAEDGGANESPLLDLAPVTPPVSREGGVDAEPKVLRDEPATEEPVAASRPLPAVAESFFEGLVVAQETGLPLSGVQVAALGHKRRSNPLNGEVLATADFAGRFSVPADPGMRTRLVAIGGEFTGPRLVELHVQDATQPQRIRLNDAASLRGTVMGLLEPAQVMARTNAYELCGDSPPHAAFMLGEPEWTAAVDPLGHFELRGLPSGIRLSLSVRSTRSKVVALAVAEPITLKAGESRQVAWTVGAGASVQGQVIGVDGAPAEGIQVALYGSSVGRVGKVESYWAATSNKLSGADGRFEFQDVQPGRWFIGPTPRSRKAKGGSEYVAMSQSIEVVEGSRSVQVTIALRPSLFVQGIVLHDDVPLKGALVVARMEGVQFHDSCQTKANGAFRLGPLPPGNVIVGTFLVNSPDGPSLIANSEEVTVPAGSNGVELRVRAGCAITLVAVDPATDEVVPARFNLSSAEFLTLSMEYETSKDFAGLLPSTFTVRAESRDGRAGIMEGMTLGAGEHADDVRIPLELAGDVQVRFDSGEGVLGVTLLRGDLRLASDGIHPGGDTTWLVPPGEYAVELLLLDWTRAQPTVISREVRQVTVQAGETTEVHFLL